MVKGGNPKTKINRLLERPSGYSINCEEKSEFMSSKPNNKGIGNLAQDVCYLWRDVPVPVIAVLHGMCFGGGRF